MARIQTLLGHLILLLVGLGAGCAVLEAGTLLVFGEQPKFPRHVVGTGFGVRINEPHAVYRHKSADVTVWFRINGQGMRAERDYPYEKPRGRQRIVSLGDSFTIGYEVDVHETFSGVLEGDLRASDYDVEVLNAGVSGYSTAEELVYLDRELFRYDPDLVLVSFSANDLVDNVRTGLFRLEGGVLTESERNFVPAGGMGDFLNTLGIFNFLGERSNAFALLKERATLFWKRRMVEENLSQIAAAKEDGAADTAVADLRRLAAAIFEKDSYRKTRERGIPLVIQSIPTPDPMHRTRLVEMFPLADFDVHREGLSFFPAQAALDPALGRTQLYHERSHGHWTPEGHRLAGRALARLVVERGLLDRLPP